MEEAKPLFDNREAATLSPGSHLTMLATLSTRAEGNKVLSLTHC
jgi:hypothetical protein